MANPQQSQSDPAERKDPNFDRTDAEQAPGQGHSGRDQGKVGQDTDGDGRVVKPGQRPGQSQGQGLDNISGRPQTSRSDDSRNDSRETGVEPEKPGNLGHDPKPEKVIASR